MAVGLTSSRNHPNVDQGWAFPFLMASLVGFALIFGISFSSAIFYVIFLEAFQRSPAATAWVVGLNTCATYLFLPINGLLNKLIGDAWSVVIGTVLSSLGLFFCIFAKDLMTLGLTFGVLTGFGWASVFIGILHGLFLFFNRYRKLAVAIATLGISFGQFVYPPLLEFLLTQFNWQGVLLILSALNLNFFVLVAIFWAGRGPELAGMEAKLLVNTEKSEKDRLQDLREICDLSKNVYYFLFNLSTVCAAIAVGAFQTHITRTSILAGHGTFSAAMLPSAIGAAGLAGRLAWGLLAQKLRRLSVLWLNVISYGSLAVVVFVCVFSRSYPTFLCTSLLFGFLSGIWALLPECMVAIIGTEHLVHGLGINGLFTGFGLLMGPPFAGWLSESDASYRLSFGISSALLVAAALLILPSATKTKCAEDAEAKPDTAESINFDV